MNRRSSVALLAVLFALALGVAWVVREVVQEEAVDPTEVAMVAGSTEPSSGAPAPAPAIMASSHVEPSIETAATEPLERKSVAAAEADADLAEALWVEGRVRFPEGTPLDERVEVLAKGRRFPSREPHLATVAPDGTFRVAFAKETKKGRLELRARYLYLTDAVLLDPAGPPGEIVLAPALGGCLRGRLVLPLAALDRRAAVVGTALHLWGQVESSRPEVSENVQHKAQVDGDLAFEIGGLSPQRRYSLNGQPHDMTPIERDAIQVQAGQVTTVEIELALGARVAGRIVDESGAGVEGVQLDSQTERAGGSWSSSHSVQKAAADGAFTLAGLRPGKITIEARKPGFAKASFEAGEMDEGAVKEGVAIVLRRGLSIAGVVRWPDGAPAGGARIQVTLRREAAEPFRGIETEDSEGKANADGTFEITGLSPGKATLTAQARRPGDAEPAAAVVEPTAAEATPPATGAEPVEAAEEGKPAPRKSRSRGPAWTARIEDLEAGATGLVLTLQPPRSVRGRVVDDTGAPVARFQVRAEPVEEVEPWRQRRGVVARSFSAPDGRFELDGLHDGEWDVTADGKGFAPSSARRVAIPRDTAELAITTPRAATLSGVVTDPGGQPAARASVRSEAPDTENPWRSGREVGTKSAKTDEEGRFELGDVPPGATLLVASSEAWTDSAPLPLEVQPGETHAGLALALRRGGRIVGEVLDPAGHPDPGRGITVHGTKGSSWQRIASDASGRFEVERLTPGVYTLQTQATETEIEAERARGGDDRALWTNVQKSVSATVVDGETTRVVIGAPPRDPVRVHGAVTAGGRPATGYRVWVHSPRGAGASPRSGSTDAQGRYEVQLDEPGEYTFNLWSEKGGGSNNRTVTVPDLPAFELDFALAAGRIAGRVIGPDGKPVRGMMVTLAPDRGLAELSSGASYGQLQTQADGAFAFESLQPGSYSVQAGGAEYWQSGKAEYGRAERSGIALAEGAAVEDVELRLPPACRVEGVVLGPSGQPAPGAAVFARDEAGRLIQTWSTCVTDASGRFRMDGVAPGRTTFQARTKLLVSPETSPVVVRADETVEVEIRLRSGTLLRVFVEDAQGRPVGASVSAKDEHGRDAAQLYSLLDQEWWGQDQVTNGRRLGPLPPGRYTVTAKNHDGVSASKDVNVSGAAEEVVTLRLGG